MKDDNSENSAAVDEQLKVEIELAGDRKNDFGQIGLINSNGKQSSLQLEGLHILSFLRK